MRIAFLIIFFLPAFIQGQEPAIRIHVLLKGMPDSSLFFLNEEHLNIDSCFSKGEKLTFTYSKKSPDPSGLLIISKDKKQGYIVWIETTSLNLHGKYGDLSPLSSDQSHTQNIFREYMSLTTHLNDSLSATTKSFQTLRFKNDPDSTKFKIKTDSISSVLKKLNVEFIKSYPNSVISTQTLFYEASHKRFTNEELIACFRELSLEQQSSPMGQAILKAVSLYQYPRIGEQAPNFSMKDINGKTVSLSDFKGRPIVLLFWASWCGPCLKELPGIIDYYNVHKGRDYTFIAVSLDNNKASWIAAVNKYQIPFINVSDLQGWMSEPALIYGVSGIPDNFLIDSKGKIATRSRGFDLIKRNMLKLTN